MGETWWPSGAGLGMNHRLYRPGASQSGDRSQNNEKEGRGTSCRLHARLKLFGCEKPRERHRPKRSYISNAGTETETAGPKNTHRVLRPWHPWSRSTSTQSDDNQSWAADVICWVQVCTQRRRKRLKSVLRSPVARIPPYYGI